MAYYFEKTIETDFHDALDRVKTALKKEDFGILSEINIQKTMQKKLNVDFHKYVILGACNPPYAYQALTAEDKIGTMLPCNVILQEKNPGKVEIATVNPVKSMQAVDNTDLNTIAIQVSDKLKRVISSL